VIVRDVWHALLLTGKNIFWGGIVIFFVSSGNLELLSTLVLVLLVQSIVIYRSNSKYKIDTETNYFIFPRSDIENSIFQILIGAKYWNLMRTKSVALSEIENIYIDTKRWQSKTLKQVGNYKDGKARHGNVTKKHVRFRINVTGSFGSANLSFLDRQKRDEVRSALQVAVKKTTGKNIDRKVSEFS
jgi:hypothetical protein